MATTGIWKIDKRLDNVIDYTTNVEKTKNEDYGKATYYNLHNVIDFVKNYGIQLANLTVNTFMIFF